MINQREGIKNVYHVNDGAILYMKFLNENHQLYTDIRPVDFTDADKAGKIALDISAIFKSPHFDYYQNEVEVAYTKVYNAMDKAIINVNSICDNDYKFKYNQGKITVLNYEKTGWWIFKSKEKVEVERSLEEFGKTEAYTSNKALLDPFINFLNKVSEVNSSFEFLMEEFDRHENEALEAHKALEQYNKYVDAYAELETDIPEFFDDVDSGVLPHVDVSDYPVDLPY